MGISNGVLSYGGVGGVVARLCVFTAAVTASAAAGMSYDKTATDLRPLYSQLIDQYQVRGGRVGVEYMCAPAHLTLYRHVQYE